MLIGFLLWYARLQKPADIQFLQEIQASEIQILQAGEIQKKEVSSKSLIIRP
jgi:hypothetical protein